MVRLSTSLHFVEHFLKVDITGTEFLSLVNNCNEFKQAEGSEKLHWKFFAKDTDIIDHWFALAANIAY